MKPCQIQMVLGLILACILAIGAILFLAMDKDGWGWFLFASAFIGISTLEIECE